MNVAGVSKIENEIKVLPLSSYDDQIRVRALRTIYGSSNFNRYALGANPPIHIIVALHIKSETSNCRGAL